MDSAVPPPVPSTQQRLAFSFVASLWGLSSLTRDRTCAPTLGAWSPNHWATREVPRNSFLRTCEEPVPPTHHCLTLQPTVEEARLCQVGKRGSEGLKELAQRRGSNTSVHSPRSRQRPPTHGSWVGWGRWSGAPGTARGDTCSRRQSRGDN